MVVIKVPSIGLILHISDSYFTWRLQLAGKAKLKWYLF